MDKVLLITGASSDIGMQLLQDIYIDYSKIYLQYRTMSDSLAMLIRSLDSKVEIVPLQVDLADDVSLANMITAIKQTQVLPNHIIHLPAPKAYNKQFHKDSWNNYESGWEISVHSIVEILQAFIPQMVKNRYGRIVFMLTSYTHNIPPKFQAGYVTVKYALLGLMKALAVEYADKGITVNGVSPDMMETKFLSEVPQLIIDKNKENSPLGRNIFVEEIIPIIQYMLSDAGAALVGQNIVVSGGS